VAQFFDTPTPNAGMRPEVEQRAIAMMNDATVPVASIVAFARENGFVVNPADIERSRAAALKTRTKFGLGYEFPKVLTDQGDGALGAAARGIGDGVLPNMLLEAGALVLVPLGRRTWRPAPLTASTSALFRLTLLSRLRRR
jgi:hypothetical protein